MKLELGYNRRFVAVSAPLPRVQNTRKTVLTRLKSYGFRGQVSGAFRLIARPWPAERTPRGAPQYQASIEIRWAKFGRAPTPRSRVEAFLFFDLSFASARAAAIDPGPDKGKPERFPGGAELPVELPPPVVPEPPARRARNRRAR